MTTKKEIYDMMNKPCSDENDKNMPGNCPNCGSENVDFGDVEFTSNETCYQDCDCNECGCSWNEVYTFTGKEEIKKGE